MVDTSLTQKDVYVKVFRTGLITSTVPENTRSDRHFALIIIAEFSAGEK